MSFALTKLSETASSLTLGWTPPQGVGGYVFYANGVAVSTASPNLKDGTPRSSVKFSKTNPGPPFQVAAVCRQGSILLLDVGTYLEAPPPPPPPPTGTLIDSLTDFKNPGNNDVTQYFRWSNNLDARADFVGVGWSQLGGEPSITEVSTEKGPGFRYRACNQQQQDTGKIAVSYDRFNVMPRNAAEEKRIYRFDFWVIATSEDNPSGFAQNYYWNNYFEFHNQTYSPQPANPHHALILGYDTISQPNKIQLQAPAMTSGAYPRARLYGPTPVRDRWYKHAVEIKLSHDTDGYLKGWVDDVEMTPASDSPNRSGNTLVGRTVGAGSDQDFYLCAYTPDSRNGWSALNGWTIADFRWTRLA